MVNVDSFETHLIKKKSWNILINMQRHLKTNMGTMLVQKRCILMGQLFYTKMIQFRKLYDNFLKGNN